MDDLPPVDPIPVYLTKIDSRDHRPIVEVRLFSRSATLGDLPIPHALADMPHATVDFDYDEHRGAFDDLFGFEEASPEHYRVRIERHGIARRVPYFLHTNYELPLMLDGRKPIAFFSDDESAPHLDDTRSAFAPFVASGQILTAEDRSDVVLPDGRPFRLLRLYYHLPGEEWRLPLLRQIHAWIWQRLWRPECDEIEGILLGYSPAENAWWRDRKTHLKGL